MHMIQYQPLTFSVAILLALVESSTVPSDLNLTSLGAVSHETTLKEQLAITCPMIASKDRPVVDGGDCVNVTLSLHMYKMLGIDDERQTLVSPCMLNIFT